MVMMQRLGWGKSRKDYRRSGIESGQKCASRRWHAIGLVALLLMVAPDLQDPQTLDKDPLWLDVELPGVNDSVELVPADPRTPELAATAPRASDGLFTGVLAEAGWPLHLVWTDNVALGILKADWGATWVSVDSGRLVEFAPEPGDGLFDHPVAMADPLVVPEESERAPSLQSASVQDGVLQIMMDADSAFYQQHGDQWRDVQLAIMHLVDAIYQANLGFPIEIVEQHVWTDGTEPWEGSPYLCFNTDSDPLRMFRNYWEGQSPTTSDERESTHLFTGERSASSTIGCAYIRQLNTPSAYGVNQVRGPMQTVSVQRHALLVSHELGHNFNGVHSLALGEDCAGGTVMYDTLCFNSPIFSGVESLALCRAGVPNCYLGISGNAQRMWNYADDHI